jgi:hypothetical protein
MEGQLLSAQNLAYMRLYAENHKLLGCIEELEYVHHCTPTH